MVRGKRDIVSGVLGMEWGKVRKRGEERGKREQHWNKEEERKTKERGKGKGVALEKEKRKKEGEVRVNEIGKKRNGVKNVL